MKQIEKNKYAALTLFALAWVGIFLGYLAIAGAVAVIGMFILFFNAHKSGNVFLVAFFAGVITVGAISDWPFDKFPFGFVCFVIFGIVFNFRTLVYERMTISKLIWLEPVASISISLVFIVGAILMHYDLRQWLTMSPLLLFGLFSFIIYKDRSQAAEMVKGLEAKIGNPAPDFTLPDQNGDPVTLNELLKKQHVLLIFVRGDWCPTCHMMLRSYFKNKDIFAQKNVRIVGVGPDPQGVNKEIMSRIDEHSLLLCDDEQETALLYTDQMQELNPINKKTLKKGIPLPASFLVHQNGKIAFTSRSDRAGEILQPDLIFKVLETF